MASVYIDKTIQRVDKIAMEALNSQDVVMTFLEYKENNKTALILKKPKTTSSIRHVYIPTTVAKMLIKWKQRQDEIEQMLGEEYTDYNLVVPCDSSRPIEDSRIQQGMKRLAEKYDLPRVCFHSIRHTSITYKLKLNGGDIISYSLSHP